MDELTDDGGSAAVNQLMRGVSVCLVLLGVGAGGVSVSFLLLLPCLSIITLKHAIKAALPHTFIVPVVAPPGGVGWDVCVVGGGRCCCRVTAELMADDCGGGY